MSSKILVSVLFYNNVSDAINTIESWLFQEEKNFDLIIIDNASEITQSEHLKRLFPEVYFIRLGHNLGYSGGNNYVLEWGYKKGYDFIIICNQDIHIEKDFMTKLVKDLPSHAHQMIGVIERDMKSKKIITAGGRDVDYFRMKAKWLNKIDDDEDKIMKADYVQGALIIFPRHVLDKGLRFDANLFMYCDEIDLGLQMKKMGIGAVIYKDLSVFHKTDDKRFSLIQGYFIHRNRVYLAKKYLIQMRYLLFLIIFITELFLKLVIRSLTGYGFFSLACFRGFLDGLKGQMGKGKYIH